MKTKSLVYVSLLTLSFFLGKAVPFFSVSGVGPFLFFCVVLSKHFGFKPMLLCYSLSTLAWEFQEFPVLLNFSDELINGILALTNLALPINGAMVLILAVLCGMFQWTLLFSLTAKLFHKIHLCDRVKL